MKTTFHFIRHGNVENPDNIYYGRLPGFPLSYEGRACIEYTAEQLRKYPITHIFSSPLLRTTQSAEILSRGLKIPFEQDQRLIEIASLFEGKNRSTNDRVPHYPVEKTDQAETIGQIYDRMANFVREKHSLYPGQHIVAVSHGGAIRALELGIEGRPLNDEMIDQLEVPICGADTMILVNNDELSVNRTDL